MTRERSTSVTSLLRIIIVKYTIGKATPKINTAVLTRPNESVPVKPVTINNIIIIAIIKPKIKLYFLRSAFVNGFEGFNPTCPKFLRLKSKYHTSASAVPNAAIKNPMWKLPLSINWLRISGATNAPLFTDI